MATHQVDSTDSEKTLPVDLERLLPVEHPLEDTLLSAQSSEAPAFSRAKTPHHVAIIMDGNRRWAGKRGLPTSLGHLKGAEVLLEIVEEAYKLGIRVLTVFSFSTENWRRTPGEINQLFQLMQDYLVLYRETMRAKGVRLKAIGDLSSLPESLKRALDETICYTDGGANIDLVLAINYGARDEILRATRRVAALVKSGELQLDQISETLFSQILDTGLYPDPDLIIRTSGEFRLSNFLLWQAGYAEVIPMEVLWPDFSRVHLIEALRQYQLRVRRHGV
jgi:undecaprenyl diphosphate synthase